MAAPAVRQPARVAMRYRTQGLCYPFRPNNAEQTSHITLNSLGTGMGGMRACSGLLSKLDQRGQGYKISHSTKWSEHLLGRNGLLSPKICLAHKSDGMSASLSEV